MDKLLIEEFHKMYFSKKAIEKRVYSSDDVGEIWKVIVGKRKETAINTCLELGVKKDYIWYNVYSRIETLVKSIEDIITNDLVNYIPKRYRDKLYKDNKLGEYEEITQLNKYITKEDFNNLILSCDYKCRNIELNEILEVTKNDSTNVADKFQHLNKYLLDNNSHPLIKAAVIYYYLVNQEFENAKLLANIGTYYYLKQNGYNNMFYQSIFKEFNKDVLRYNKAMNESLEHDNDATYFIIYFLEVLNRIAIKLNADISGKFGKKIIIGIIEANNIEILDRQLNFVLNNIDKQKNIFTISDYKDEANVVYETARTDLNNLITLGFFKISKSGKKFLYHLNDLGTIIDNLQY